MLYSELRSIYEDLEAFQALREAANGFQKEKIDILIRLADVDEPVKLSLKPHQLFDFDALAEKAFTILSITNGHGHSLRQWLQLATFKFYQTIDIIVNQWLNRLRIIEGTECIYENPRYGQKDYTKNHCLWFEDQRRTCLDIGFNSLDLSPFSFKRYSTGYGHGGTGFIFPRTEALSVLLPTKEEETVMRKYGVDYQLFESVEVTRYELQAYCRPATYEYDNDIISDDSD